MTTVALVPSTTLLSAKDHLAHPHLQTITKNRSKKRSKKKLNWMKKRRTKLRKRHRRQPKERTARSKNNSNRHSVLRSWPRPEKMSYRMDSSDRAFL